MIPLICLDVDGTLVGKSGQVSDAVWQAAAAALDRGQHLALATARGAFGASWDMAQKLDPNGWHVFHAGGAIVHAATADARGDAVPAGAVSRATELAIAEGWTLEYYTADAYAVSDSSDRAIDHAALMGVPFEQRALDALDGTLVRLQYVVPEADSPRVLSHADDLGLTGTSATSPIMPGTAFVSFTVAGVTKATGIQLIADQLGIGMADVMMVGDGHNDLPALEAVGHPVAMGNAVAEAKDLARHIVADVELDGVVEALELSTAG